MSAAVDSEPTVLTRPVRARFEARRDDGVPALAARIGLDAEVARLREFLADWIETCDPEVIEMVRYALGPAPAGLHSLTLLACHTAAAADPTVETVIPVAAAVELFQRHATILDDMIDHDRVRDGRQTLHCRFGRLPALMLSAYFAFAAGELIADDPDATRLFAGLGRRMAVAECRQWQVRRNPFGLSTWRAVAAEVTGGTFEACARVAAGDARLVRFAYLLGTLHQGCDDVADLREALAGRPVAPRVLADRILTLPVAIATEDPETARLFAEAERNPELVGDLARRLEAALPAAESMLDDLAAECEREARAKERLIELVRHRRARSSLDAGPC
jgi:geranylgeranyl diphosphate synthase, type I